MIINLYGGPGSGKSTMASGLFYEMKMAGLSVELALEYAKDLVWEERHSTLKNQPYLFGKQYNRIQRLIDKVDFIITDSPLLLCCFYAGENYPVSFRQSVVDIFRTMRNRNYFINRVKSYSGIGRYQSEDEATKIDNSILELLDTVNVDYTCIDGRAEGLVKLKQHVLRLSN